ncbi:MAG: type II toxin-antitoxin system HicB family antitoxin [Acidiferrobacterales bacterium]
MMRYKDYVAKVEFDDEAGLLHGEVINTRDVITFQGQSVDDVRQAFRESVDAYLEFCADRGEEPEKPFSGKFVVRVSSELHQRAFIAAQRAGKSLNAWIGGVLDNAAAFGLGVGCVSGVDTASTFPVIKIASAGLNVIPRAVFFPEDGLSINSLHSAGTYSVTVLSTISGDAFASERNPMDAALKEIH